MEVKEIENTMEGITGRDNYIIAQALICAIRAIDKLPPERQPLSNQADMKAILDHMVPDPRQLELLMAGDDLMLK